MKIIDKYNIGLVSLELLSSADLDSSKYSDGTSEDVLLDIFKDDNPQQKANDTLADLPPWPIYYHLSPFRKNVIDWCEFKPDSSVLEIGAGCGAITEALLAKNVSVTALELTKKRAEINANRNKKSNKLKVVVGNLSDYQPSEKFDYVVCVGVLEYSNLFIKGDNPDKEFITQMKKLLNEKGVLILAIENRLGLKYFSGAREDHTGGFFDGINQYPKGTGVKTYGKKELEKLLTSGGFAHSDFYYPFPDYKNPSFIFSDDFNPGEKAEFPIKSLPVKSHDSEKRNRIHLFSEQLAMLSIESNQLFTDLANSFIVMASTEKQKKEQVKFFTATPLRKPNYQITTYAAKEVGDYYFYKRASGNSSKPHIETIENNYKLINKAFNLYDVNVAKPRRIDSGAIRFDYIEGQTLERVIFELIVNEKVNQALEQLSRYTALVEKVSKELPKILVVDLNFDNIIVSGKKWTLIDYEWVLKEKADSNLVSLRSLLYFIGRYSSSFKILANRGDYVKIADDMYLPRLIQEKFSDLLSDVSAFQSFEKKFQKLVNGNEDSALSDMVFFPQPRKPTKYDDYLTRSVADSKKLSDKDRMIRLLERDVSLLKNSKKQIETNLRLETDKRRNAELTSLYYLTKKVINRISPRQSK